MSESKEQIALIQYSRLKPWGRCLLAIPNGGKRNVIEAAKMKREGVMAGALDLQLLIARSGYNGLWLEMKWRYNKLTESQLNFIDMATEQNYYCCCAWTMERGIELIERYLADEAIEGDERLQKQQSGKHKKGK